MRSGTSKTKGESYMVRHIRIHQDNKVSGRMLNTMQISGTKTKLSRPWSEYDAIRPMSELAPKKRDIVLQNTHRAFATALPLRGCRQGSHHQ